ncbi:MAG TPA: copper-binding protein, partial [Thermodesulfovibrionales bacterium]|nr:copper-binding protein [Thermodesulfovibrionales bacterium]
TILLTSVYGNIICESIRIDNRSLNSQGISGIVETMKWLLVFVLFPALALAAEECTTQFEGKCRTVCTPNEMLKQGAFADCGEHEQCCVPRKSSAKQLKKVSGRITAIDRAEKSITLEGMTILADEGMFANIKVGDRVTVDYYSRGVHRAVFILQEVK